MAKKKTETKVPENAIPHPPKRLIVEFDLAGNLVGIVDAPEPGRKTRRFAEYKFVASEVIPGV